MMFGSYRTAFFQKFSPNVLRSSILILLVQRTNGKSIKNAVCIFYKGGSVSENVITGLPPL